MQLRVGGQARALAILAGIEASRGEFDFHNRKPTKVPNKVPTITIPIDHRPPGKQQQPDRPPGSTPGEPEDPGELVAAFAPL